VPHVHSRVIAFISRSVPSFFRHLHYVCTQATIYSQLHTAWDIWTKLDGKLHVRKMTYRTYTERLKQSPKTHASSALRTTCQRSWSFLSVEQIGHYCISVAFGHWIPVRFTTNLTITNNDGVPVFRIQSYGIDILTPFVVTQALLFFNTLAH